MMSLLYRNLLPFALALIVMSIVGCDDDSPMTVDHADPRAEQLKSVYDNGIEPAHSQFIVQATELAQVLEDYAAAPGTEGLQQARSRWVETTKQWKKVELYNIFTVSTFFLHTRIHRWPAAIPGIKAMIEGDETLNVETLERKGSSVIGLGAMEFLLFESSIDSTNRAFTLNPRRGQLLLALGDYIIDVANEVNDKWISTGPDFINNTELSIDGGQNQLVNGLIAYLDNTIRFRLRIPAGAETGQGAQPEAVEAPISQASLELLHAGFDEWRQAYYGSPDPTSGYGFDDYLKLFPAEELIPRVDEAIDAVNGRLDSLIEQPTPLQSLIVDQPGEVDALIADYQALLVLMRVDVNSTIGTILTVNDADGD